MQISTGIQDSQIKAVNLFDPGEESHLVMAQKLVSWDYCC